jgi:hypothetical protein
LDERIVGVKILGRASRIVLV